MIKKYVLLILLAAVSQLALAQCATDEYQRELLKDPAIAAQYQHHLDNLPGHIEYKGEGKNKKATRIIPVVFHIVHQYGEENISKAQILEQLETLNEDFTRTNADTSNTRAVFKSIAANMDIEFRLARVAQDGSCTEGITRTYSDLADGGDINDGVKKLIRWDYTKYLNIWVIKRIERNWNPPSFVAGFATFPFSTSSATDGIVIRHDFVGSTGTSNSGRAGRTLTHEVGHWLGLYHPFQGGCTTNFSWTDQVDDTPPVSEPSYGCNLGTNSCNNDNPNQVDQIENYMDYSNGSCQNMFSAGQKQRVENVVFGNGYRTSNFSNGNLTNTGVLTNPSCGPIADFYSMNFETIICAGSGDITFNDFSYNGEISSRVWEFEGGTPATSSDANPVVSYNIPGRYRVKLTVENSSGIDSMIREEFITVLPAIAVIKAPYPQTFEQASFINEGWQLEENSGNGWIRRVNVAASGSASAECQIDDNTPDNERYSMILPPIDVEKHGSPINLNFKYAYARRLSTSTEVLIVMVSENCGESWRTLRGLTASNGLASKDGVWPGFFPSQASDWAHISLDVSSYAGSTNLMFRFDVISKRGNSVFLDNINVAQFGLGEDLISPLDRFVIFPNPTENSISVNVEEGWSNSDVEIRDLSGRLLLQSKILSTEAQLDLSSFSNGIYLVHLTKDGVRRSQRLVINR